ncbi:MAG: hypothetical protein ABWY08_17535, partial [Comamonas sp.]
MIATRFFIISNQLSDIDWLFNSSVCAAGGSGLMRENFRVCSKRPGSRRGIAARCPALTWIPTSQAVPAMPGRGKEAGLPARRALRNRGARCAKTSAAAIALRRLFPPVTTG